MFELGGCIETGSSEKEVLPNAKGWAVLMLTSLLIATQRAGLGEGRPAVRSTLPSTALCQINRYRTVIW